MNRQAALFELESALRPWQRPTPGRTHALSVDTERAAARKVAPRTGTLRAKIVEALQQAPEGLTAYELWDAIGGLQYSVFPRVPELVRAGLVVDSGERRATPSGSAAIVWVLV